LIWLAVREQLGDALRAARKQLGLTQPQLALAAGVGVRFIVDLEAGKPTLRLANVLRVIDALGGELQLSGLPSSVVNGEGEGVPVSGRLGERGNGT
jgi:HTH-type transcriptional regulator/antitoxin HipB